MNNHLFIDLSYDSEEEGRCNDIVCAIDFPDGWTGDTTLVRSKSVSS